MSGRVPYLKSPGARSVARAVTRGAALSTPVSYVPLSVSSPVAWWRADLGVTLNGSDVSHWAPAGGSGNGFEVSETVTATQQPAFLAASGPNSTPCIDFERNDTHALAAVDDDSMDLAGPVTIFAVFHKESGSGIQSILSKGESGLHMNYAVAATSNIFRARYHNRESIGPTVISGSDYILIVELASTYTKFSLNGVFSENTGESNTMDQRAGDLVIGGFQQASGTPRDIFDGKICEVGIYHAGLITSGEGATLEAYAAARYGISI